MPLDFGGVQALTFDCYGTLIDWERGLLQTLQPLLRRHGVALDDDEVLERYARLEAALEAGPYQPYRAILSAIVERLAGELGFVASAAERAALPGSLGDWPPFPDTVAALRQLAGRFRLGVISNTDDDLFAATERQLGVAFDWVITAQQAGAYKPSLRPFQVALERLQLLPPERIVHVAQSLFHDHVPATQLGLRTVWVNRRRGRPGFGATPPAAAQPDLEVATLAELAAATARDQPL